VLELNPQEWAGRCYDSIDYGRTDWRWVARSHHLTRVFRVELARGVVFQPMKA
jgi:hypothetical protein